MVKKALLQVIINHSNGLLIKLYATKLNLFDGNIVLLFTTSGCYLILVEISLFCTK